MARPKKTKRTSDPSLVVQETPKEPKQMTWEEVRKKLYEDFEFWAKWSCKIRTKEGEVRPLVLNAVQKRFAQAITDQMRTDGKVRMIILKARQQGLSTVVSAWQYWWLSQHPAQKGIVVAHKADSTRTLFDMYKRIHENCPEPIRPSTKYSSRRELVFDRLDTSLTVATAGGDGIARGETLQCAHQSEVAFWPPDAAEENFNALDQAIPNTKGTAVFIESTANGMSGIFYNLWQGAVEGTNGYYPFFSAWFETPGYREKAPENFELTYEEMDLKEKFNLDNDQIYWRRRKIAASGRELFMQEYPATPDEAFISSGRPVFNPDQVTEMLRNAPMPIQRLALEGTRETGFEWRENPRGELLVYKPMDHREFYTIGADVAMGQRNGDYSVAQVLDSRKRQVAVWRGHVHPDFYADVLEQLGFYYNEARIAVENNAHGLLTAVRLGKDLAYPNTYTEVGEGKLIDQDSINIGFRVTAKTKPLIIDRLRGALREHEIEIYDRNTLKEMLSYVVTESGAMEAEPGCFDDAVMSLALANHVHEGYFLPIDITDEFYVTAI